MENKPEGGNQLPTLIDLLDKYKGQEVPSKELNAIGYERIRTEDGVNRYVRIKTEEEKMVEKSKEKVPPFGEIEVKGFADSSPFRAIPPQEAGEIKKHIDGIIDGYFETLPHLWMQSDRPFDSAEKMSKVIQDISRFFKIDLRSGEEITLYEVNSLFMRSLPLLIEEDDESVKILQAINESLSSAAYDGRLVTKEESEDMVADLVRIKAKEGDVIQIRNVFNGKLNDPLVTLDSDGKKDVEDFGGDPELCEELAQFFESRNLRTYSDFVCFAFSEYLKSENMKDLGDVLNSNQNPEELIKRLREVNVNLELIEKEKQLKEELKLQSDRRNRISTQLKKIKEEKERRISIQNGLIQYFNYPEILGRGVAKQLDKVISHFKRKESEEKEILLRLDARPNTQLDADPGKKSGDCTEGKPLPFDDKNTPVFNVKVYTGDKHVGNIYLLETVIYFDANDPYKGAGEEKVWHLEATQVSTTYVNWEKTVGPMVDALAKVGKEKGVAAITVNAQTFQISNYSETSASFVKYWKTNKRLVTNIKVPEVTNPNRSNFQSTGDVRVLWSSDDAFYVFKQESEDYYGEEDD